MWGRGERCRFCGVCVDGSKTGRLEEGPAAPELSCFGCEVYEVEGGVGLHLSG